MPSNLESLVSQFDSRDLPPIEQWRPARTSTIDMVIDQRGEWFYRGSRIDRKRMVALFSTILWREEETYYLITPHEKLEIVVECAPFVAVLMDVSGSGEKQSLRITDNTGNRFTVGKQHPLWISDTEAGEPRPMVMVRRNLPALLSRAVYYQLAELLVETDAASGVWSEGAFFKLDG